MVVMLYGRTREMPDRIDCALTMPTIRPDDVLRQEEAMEAPSNKAGDDDVAGAAEGADAA